MAKPTKGARGARGIPGPPGPRGAAGSVGHQGPTGHAGRSGAPGRTGARGQAGKGAPVPSGDAKKRRVLLASVDRHIENIYGELTVQMKRMAKLQAQIDELRYQVKRIL